MTSIAQEKSTTAATASVERAVFVTDDDRRSRIVRRVTLIVLVAAGLWLAALAVGMLGLGRLPGVSLPLPAVGGKGRQHVDRPITAPIVPAAVVRRTTTRTNRPTMLRSSAATATTAVARKQAKAKAAAARTRSAPARRRAATRASRTTTPPGQASTPTRAARGLNRRGLTAAPGQTRKATVEPKAAPGQAKTPQGQAKKATEAGAPPPPAPPGQQKPDKPPAKA